LLRDFKGEVDLVYIDPPFDVGADFTLSVPLGDEREEVGKDQSALEVVAYRDTWGKGTDSYLHMIYERLVLMRDLLGETGSIFVHCDWRVSHLLRSVLAEVFAGGFRNELVWCYTGPGSPGMSQYNRKHDTIHWYSRKPDGFKFNDVEIRVPHDEKTLANFKEQLRGSGFVAENYALPEGKIPEDWWEMAIAARFPVDGLRRAGYATEKPWALIERIVRTCTEEGDLVADLFCGSGTTGTVAEMLGRRWLLADLGRFAIHTSRKRLIEAQRRRHTEGKPYRAFDVYNLGRYERQWWQKERLEGADAEHRRIVLEFFRAEILSNPPSSSLHGRKGAAFCHVDSIDSIFTRDEAKVVAQAASDAGAKQVYCLSWEFEMDLKIECNRLEKEFGVEIRLIQIPREIMEKNRKEPPPFLEVATLTAEPVFHEEQGQRAVDIRLTSFLPSLSEVPTKELETLRERAMKSGFDFIDFWAVDFDFRNGNPFHHDWQDYRLRKDRSLKTTSQQRHVYDKPGIYTACVKVVDIFGSDTSITVEVPYD
jgi:adenine-specific DNA-methyltransferase